MTASAKKTATKPGKNIEQKAGLNRAVLDAAPGSSSILHTKTEEAGLRTQASFDSDVPFARKHQKQETVSNASIVAAVASSQRQKPQPLPMLADG
jgi:hypothetical protein